MDFAKLTALWADFLVIVSVADDFKEEWEHIKEIIADIKARMAANDEVKPSE